MANEDQFSEGFDAGMAKGGPRKHRSGKGAGRGMDAAKGAAAQGGNPWSILSYLPKLHKGGKVRKTGPYMLKKGETVITAKQAKTLKLASKKKSGRKKVTRKA